MCTPARLPLAAGLLAASAWGAIAAEPVLRGAGSFRFDPRLEELFETIDPAKAGWESEVFHDGAKGQLHHLCEAIESAPALTAEAVAACVAEGATATGFDRGSQTTRSQFDGSGLAVRRFERSEDAAPLPLAGALDSAFAAIKGGPDARHAIKIESVELAPDGTSAATQLRVQFCCDRGGGARAQINHRWTATWSRPAGGAPPRITALALIDGSEVIPDSADQSVPAPDRLAFADATVALLGDNPCFAAQLAPPYDHWRARSDRLMGTDFTSNQGVALGDADGDGLDELFLSQPGGLPNKLFRHLPDGRAEDISAACGLDYLDFTRTALFVDFDNDGDQDLVVGLSWHLIFIRNDGPAAGGGVRFTPRFRAACPGMVYALAAADYDGDGDVDLYASGRYADDSLASERQVLGIPVPYHDANNGGRSSLWRNEGELVFKDVTAEVGLDQNNTRFTLAAAWEDYDGDGDQDLYVANDFGRNNLYRNDGGKFTDAAAAAGVEDIGAGMSASWGDYDGDGLPDLYVANMYSSAGHRIASQARFMEGADPRTAAAFLRHARGNSLFRNRGDGTFEDTTMAAGVNMGRWAWSSLFADLDNDGRRDLIVANGFISAEGTDDL